VDMNDTIRCYKLIRNDGNDLYSGKLAYVVGETISIDAAPEALGICATGLHASPTIRDALISARRLGRSYESRPWRVLELEIATADVVASDEGKMRCRRVRVVREIPLAEAIETVLPGWPQRLERGRSAIADVRDVAWLKPVQEATQDDVSALLGKWHGAIVPFLRGRPTPPRAARIITDRAKAARLAADAHAADDADARLYWRTWWYVRTQVWRTWRWAFAGLDPDKNPARWMLEIWKLGLLPIGYVRDGGEVFFAIYHPPVVAQVLS